MYVSVDAMQPYYMVIIAERVLISNAQADGGK